MVGGPRKCGTQIDSKKTWRGEEVIRQTRDKEIFISLGRYATIMQSELISIEASIQLAKRDRGRKKVSIFFYNTAALTASQNISMESY